MQHEITRRGLLLNPDGSLSEPGWAKSLILDYNKFSIRANRFRIKEWDYYLVNDDEMALAFTMFNAGYMGMLSVSVIDLGEPSERTMTKLVPLPGDKILLPTSSDGTASSFDSGRVTMLFDATSGKRVLDVVYRKFDGNDDFMAHIELDRIPQDSMVIATPWKEDPTAFYYNQKTVGMRATGDFCIGERTHSFSAERSFGLLDWGRGVWTYDNRWFWGVGQGWQNGHVAAFNIGYGFGDTTAASENMFFLDGVCHKLDRVDFGIPRKADGSFDFMKPWHMTSNDGRWEMDFSPDLDRTALINLGAIVSDQHQVFGTISGTVILDDGTPFKIADMIASAEVIHNKY